MILIGTLFAGPKLDATGELIVTDIPASKQIVKSHTGVMVNLGYYVKANEIMEFKSVIKDILEKY